MKKLLFLCTLLIILGLSLFVFVAKNAIYTKKEPVINKGFFCGTSRFTSKNASKGKRIFNAHCAACHKLDKKMTGPALRNISQKCDSITLYKHIKGLPNTILKSTNYNMSCMPFPELTSEEISYLLEYTN